MKNKLVTIAVIISLILIAAVFIYLALNNFKKQPSASNEESCVPWNDIRRLEIEACYHPDSKNIMLTIKRLEDDYNLKDFDLKFSNQNFKSTTFPENDGFKIYKTSSQINPNKAELFLTGTIRNKNICNESKTIIIKNCSQTANTNLSIAIFLQDISTKLKEEDIVPYSPSAADILPEELFNENQILDLKCKSTWNCGNWEECVNGVQKRICKDKNNCIVSINIPSSTKYCNGSCTENWECQWSKCNSEYSTPSCKDKNSCGTTYHKPEKIACYSKKTDNCIPDILCESWSSCEVDYNFINILSPEITLSGIKYRTCRDKNKCVSSFYESNKCSSQIDIYTKWGVYEGQSYIEIYNRLTEELLTRIAISKEQEKYFNIELL